MKPLFLSVPGQMLEKKVGALLHLLAAHIENLRVNAAGTIAPVLDEHQLCVAFSRGVIVAADGGKLESFVDQIPNPGEHFHAAKFHFNEGKSTTQRTVSGKNPWAF